jgi:hypothetical protein
MRPYLFTYQLSIMESLIIYQVYKKIQIENEGEPLGIRYEHQDSFRTEEGAQRFIERELAELVESKKRIFSAFENTELYNEEQRINDSYEILMLKKNQQFLVEGSIKHVASIFYVEPYRLSD